MRSAIVVLPIVMLLGACADLPDEKVDREPESNSLKKAIQIRERMEGGRSWTIPSERTLQRVDYKSRLEIVPNVPALEALAPRKGGALEEPSAGNQQRIGNLKKLLDTATSAYD